MGHRSRNTILSFLVLGLTACGEAGDAPTGKLSLSITDAPVDAAKSVVIQFSAVAFKLQGSAHEIIQNLPYAPRQLDLLEYQEGRAAPLLGGVTLPAGNYEWIRLVVDSEPNVRDSYIVLASGEECELRVPSGNESGLKLNRGFPLPANDSIALTIDFDLRKSVYAPAGLQGSTPDCTQAYLLRPTLRLVDDANVGAIAGDVDTTQIPEDCLPKVYVYSGSDVTPDDIEGSGAAPDMDPLVVANVAIENGNTAWAYYAAFLPPATYTVALTCDSDDPTDNDVLNFLSPQNVTVEANMMSTASFARVAP